MAECIIRILFRRPPADVINDISQLITVQVSNYSLFKWLPTVKHCCEKDVYSAG